MRLQKDYYAIFAKIGVNLLIIKTISKMKKTTKTINESKKSSTTAKAESVAENSQGIESDNDFCDVEFKNLEFDNLDDDILIFPDCILYDDLPI